MKEDSSKKSVMTYFVLAIGILAVTLVLLRAVMWLNSDDINSLYPTKVGIEPYQYSEHEQEIFDFLELDRETALLKIKAPKDTGYLSFHLHTLKQNGLWTTSLIDGFDLNENDTQFEATLGLIRNDDDSIEMEFGYRNDGKWGWVNDIATPEISFDAKSKSWGFLYEFQKIEFDNEIPIAFLAMNDDNEIPNVRLSDYYDTSNLFYYDYVQIVTMTFRSEKA